MTVLTCDGCAYEREIVLSIDEAWLCADCAAEARAECDAEAERVRLREALAELVALKDGPRDADYHRRKPLAWQKAREALS